MSGETFDCPFCKEPVVRVVGAKEPFAVDLQVQVYKVTDGKATLAPDQYRADHRLVCIILRASRAKVEAAEELAKLRERIAALESENLMLAGTPE